MSQDEFQPPQPLNPSAAEIPPARVPQSIEKPASASMWASAGDEKAEVVKEAPYSAQSQQLIDIIEEGLKDPDCTQIDGYGPGKFSAQFQGVNQRMEGLAFSSTDEYLRWLKSLVDDSGAVTTWNQILAESRGVLNLKQGGRLTIKLPPITTAPAFSLRKHVASSWSAVHFIENGTLTKDMMDFLRACVIAKANILFVGQMGSGKTTLLRSLTHEFDPADKITVVEQVPELNLQNQFAVPELYQPNLEGFEMADILDDDLYFGVDRLIVGEVHLKGITKMLETMIITEGSMSTYHAFSTEQAGERMKLALQIENQNVTSQTALAFIKNAIELVVVIERVHGKRRVVQITELDWRSSGGKDSLGGRDLFVYDRQANGGDGAFKATGNPPDPSGRIQLKREKYGVPMKHSWFLDREQLARLQAHADRDR